MEKPCQHCGIPMPSDEDAYLCYACQEDITDEHADEQED